MAAAAGVAARSSSNERRDGGCCRPPAEGAGVAPAAADFRFGRIKTPSVFELLLLPLEKPRLAPSCRFRDELPDAANKEGMGKDDADGLKEEGVGPLEAPPPSLDSEDADAGDGSGGKRLDRPKTDSSCLKKDGLALDCLAP